MFCSHVRSFLPLCSAAILFLKGAVERSILFKHSLPFYGLVSKKHTFPKSLRVYTFLHTNGSKFTHAIFWKGSDFPFLPESIPTKEK